MNRAEFKQFWDKCILPTFEEFAKVDEKLYIRHGSADSLCRAYNDIKNCTKAVFMKKDDAIVKLDRQDSSMYGKGNCFGKTYLQNS